MRTTSTLCATALCASAVAATPARAALEDDVKASLGATRLAISVADGALTGPGGQWLLAQAKDARFTLIGESHLTAETPAFTDALLRALRPAGYNAYVVECGPESTRLLMDAIQAGGLEAGEALLTEYPFSIAFLDQREEMKTASDAARAGYHVWGIDQEFMGCDRLLLHRLQELAQDDESRALAQAMFTRSLEGFRQFASTGDPSSAFMANGTDDDFNALSASFANEGGEALRIIDQIRQSAAIYRAYNDGRYYDNNSTRIALMKRNLLAHLNEANLSPLAGWKAVFKAGTYHMGRGHTPMKVLDVGNFASELAIASGSESFHVFVTAAGKVGADGVFDDWSPQAPYLTPFYEQAGEDGPVVFDLRPLRSVITQSGKKSDAMQDLEELALAFDALVLYPRFHQADAIVPMPGQ